MPIWPRGPGSTETYGQTCKNVAKVRRKALASFKVNGRQVHTGADKDLLAFLRDDLKIKSVKDGCGEGACGACSVLVDGVSRRACTLRVQSLDGKTVLTVEGFSDYEKEVYAYCFSVAGAVQCGFCIPGMVISAKALLGKNKTPDKQEIKKALAGNICRCTGYKKIIEAIEMAALFLRENLPVPAGSAEGRIARDVFRIDTVSKVLGTGEYVDDMEIKGMVYASAVRSKYPRAVVEDIDISRAMEHMDTITVITAKDIPGSNKSGHIVRDWDTLIAKGDTTRYVGDSVALVVSAKKESLEEIKQLVDVKYRPLTPVTSPQMALAENAPPLHENGNLLREDRVRRGEDVEAVFARSKHVVSHVYKTPPTEHAFMEPECAVCKNDGGVLTLYTASQSIYDEQREIAHILGLPKEDIHIISKLVGGGFGGKEDMSVQHHAALASLLTGRTVKVKLSRQESINVHPKRHAMEIEMTTACDENGNLTAMRARITSDTGAYASLGGPVVQRACTHAAGPYSYQSVDIRGRAVYTNNPPGGAFRGFGVTQSCFATECNLNELARLAGITPWEIRYKNAIKPGKPLPNGQIADKAAAYGECLLALREAYESEPYAGIAGALKNSGLGVAVPDTGRCIASVEKGKLHIRTGAARVGQGLDTVALQIACETLDLPPETVCVEVPDTHRTPDSGTTTASRQTLFTGEAVRRACIQIKEEMDRDVSLAEMDGREFYGEYTCITDPIDTDKENPFSHATYTYGAQVVALDEEGRVKKVYAAYDAGQIINRKSTEGQVEGGIIMGLGYALTEDYPLEGGYPKARYRTLGLWRAPAMPEMDVRFVCTDYKLDMAYGAKGIGEIATIPTAPAVAGAYYRMDGKFRTELPLRDTPYRKKG
jgi:selenium-dependent xanthine dehydrogenase